MSATDVLKQKTSKTSSRTSSPTRCPDENQLPQRFTQFLYSIIAGLSGVVIGTAFAWNSAAARLTRTSDIDDCNVHRKKDDWYSDAAACYFLGTAVGALVLGPTARAIGYRWSVVACDAVVFVGWLSLSRLDWAPVWATRLAHGIGTGGLGLLTPVYISHIADFRIRGRALMFHHAYVCFGVFYAHAFGAIVSDAQLIGVCMAWPALHSLLAIFLPESPVYEYKRHGDSDAARTAVLRVKGIDQDVDSDYTALERYMFRFECMKSDCRSRAMVRKMFGIGVTLVVLQQTCGACAAFFHVKSVFGGFGLTAEVEGYSDERVSAVTQSILTIVLVVQVFLCLAMVELVEVLGRKFTLIASAVGMGTCLVLLIVYQHFYPTMDVRTSPVESNEWHRYVPVTLVCLYLCSYTIGWGSVVSLVYAEVVYANKWFSSVIYAGGNFVLFLVAYWFFDANALLGFNKSVLWMNIASCALGVVFVCFCVPETRSLPLDRVLLL